MLIFKKIAQYQSLVWGMLFPLAFAPMQQPIFLYLSLLGFFHQILKKPNFKEGLLFGIGLGSCGLSWIYISIHEYGHLSIFISSLLTAIFIFFIAVFYGGFVWLYKQLRIPHQSWTNPFILASSWCSLEWLRAHIFGGFPWLLIGYASINSPLKKLLPWFGLYAPSFCICLGIACFLQVIHRKPYPQFFAALGVFCFISPQYLPVSPNLSHSPIQVAMIQSNVTIQDKWNEDFFWQQYQQYFHQIQALLAPQRIIILPEAAISIPSSYLQQELKQLSHLAYQKNSGILLGIPKTSKHHVDEFYNALLGLGHAQGTYLKQQLVIFSEKIPKFWRPLLRFLNIPVVSTRPGHAHQALIKIFNHPIASLICYEVAYPEILRRQLPHAEWIVSISEDAWFGHSFAVYQHLEMAQTLSYMSQRWQFFINNNGLSSLISHQGQIIKQLPAWRSGELMAHFYNSQTLVPWISWGDRPMLSLITGILILFAGYKILQQIPIIRQETLKLGDEEG